MIPCVFTPVDNFLPAPQSSIFQTFPPPLWFHQVKMAYQIFGFSAGIQTTFFLRQKQHLGVYLCLEKSCCLFLGRSLEFAWFPTLPPLFYSPLFTPRLSFAQKEGGNAMPCHTSKCLKCWNRKLEIVRALEANLVPLFQRPLLVR